MAEIMLIENDSILADLIQLSLEQTGHQVTWHTEKADALTAFKKRRPDLIVLDLFLPQTDTLALIRQLRNPVDRRNPPPVIVLSALGYSEVVESALKAGAADYLLKPLNPDVLLDRVQYLLSQSGKTTGKAGRTISKPQFRRIR
jgi:DNA-binding response OmpR family regulator